MRTMWMCLGVLVVTACSSDDEQPAREPLCPHAMDAAVANDDSDAGVTPPEQCEDFLDTFCDRVVECDPTPPTYADCISTQRTYLDCGAVSCVSEAFDRCVADIRAQTCTVWNSTSGLPASCAGALVVE